MMSLPVLFVYSEIQFFRKQKGGMDTDYFPFNDNFEPKRLVPVVYIGDHCFGGREGCHFFSLTCYIIQYHNELVCLYFQGISVYFNHSF